MLPIRTILCPLDFSDPSDKALQNAVELARHFQAEVVLVHVAPIIGTQLPADPAYIFQGPQDFQQQQKVAGQERLSIAAKQIPPGIKSRIAIGNGDPADEIVRLGNTEAADLIVIATHGLTGWRHFVFGSVAEKVIRLSDRPVLVIPAHESD